MKQFEDYIPKEDYKRTLNLLYITRKEYGIDFFILLRKILLVGALVNYYQKQTNTGHWISYHKILSRNEDLFIHNKIYRKIDENKKTSLMDMEYFKSINGLTTQSTFFGINPNIMQDKPFPLREIIQDLKIYWIKEYHIIL